MYKIDSKFMRPFRALSFDPQMAVRDTQTNPARPMTIQLMYCHKVNSVDRIAVIA